MIDLFVKKSLLLMLACIDMWDHMYKYIYFTYKFSECSLCDITTAGYFLLLTNNFEKKFKDNDTS